MADPRVTDLQRRLAANETRLDTHDQRINTLSDKVSEFVGAMRVAVVLNAIIITALALLTYLQRR